MSDRKIWFVTLFPEIIESYISNGVISRYREYINIVNPAKYTSKGFKGVDCAPYGGGPGMVMRVDVLAEAIEKGVYAHYDDPKRNLHVIYTGPEGDKWCSKDAKRFASSLCESDQDSKDIVFICGRYEGVDQRFIDLFVDKTYSLGEFVLSGGEIAALAFADSLLRFVPGVLGNPDSCKNDSFENDEMDYPKWTRPRRFRDVSVPDVLLSGDHKKVEFFNNSRRPNL